MQLSSDGTVLLSARNKDIINGTLVIPPGILRIEKGALQNNTKLKLLVIPAGMIIGKNAFNGCKNLESLEIFEDVTLEDGAFENCSSLEGVRLPPRVLIGARAFFNCKKMKYLDAQQGVVIGDEAFRGCVRLVHLSMLEHVKIGRAAFRDCKSIEELSVLEGVIIGDNAFDGCVGMKYLLLHEGLVIGANAFQCCIRISELHIPKNVSVGNQAFENCIGIRELIISPDIVIGDSAFHGCNSIKALTIPTRVQLGESVFLGCNRLTQLKIADGVSIGKKAFFKLTSLHQLEMGVDVMIGESAFSGTASLEVLIVKAGSSIAARAFSSCQKLKNFMIDEGVPVGEHAFNKCVAWEHVYVNTENRQEIARIKKSIHYLHRYKVKQNPFYKKVIKLQQDLVCSDPRLSDLTHIPYLTYHNLPYDIQKYIASYERTHAQQDALQVTKAKTRTWCFPYNSYSFSYYVEKAKNELFDIKLSEDQMSALGKQACATKLQAYIHYLEHQKGIKQHRTPGFFEQKPMFCLEINQKIAGIKKAVALLDGDDSMMFTREEVDMLSQGFIGKLLSGFILALPVSKKTSRDVMERSHGVEEELLCKRGCF